jgi:hypothetical protein
MRRGHDGIVPVLYSNLRRVETQLSKSSKTLRNLSEVISWSLPLARRKVFLGVAQWVCEEDAQLVEHRDGPEDKGFVWAVALLEVHPYACGGEMEGKGVSDKHGRCVNVGEGQIADELGLDDGADFREVGVEVVRVADDRASCDCCLDLAEVFLGLSEEFFCFAVVGGGLTLFGEGL